jgi:hypothetical protein
MQFRLIILMYVYEKVTEQIILPFVRRSVKEYDCVCVLFTLV